MGERGEELTSETTDVKLHEIRADLTRAMAQLEESVSKPKPTTRCLGHPTGPVDGSGRDLCLLCETRRRGGGARPPPWSSSVEG
ncbi:hypothetical protein ABZZ74_53665, partial [Streptomyces sp. NPDC006476]